MWGEGTVPIPSCRTPSRLCGNPGVKCQKTEPSEEGECYPPAANLLLRAGEPARSCLGKGESAGYSALPLPTPGAHRSILPPEPSTGAPTPHRPRTLLQVLCHALGWPRASSLLGSSKAGCSKAFHPTEMPPLGSQAVWVGAAPSPSSVLTLAAKCNNQPAVGFPHSRVPLSPPTLFLQDWSSRASCDQPQVHPSLGSLVQNDPQQLTAPIPSPRGQGLWLGEGGECPIGGLGRRGGRRSVMVLLLLLFCLWSLLLL